MSSARVRHFFLGVMLVTVVLVSPSAFSQLSRLLSSKEITAVILSPMFGIPGDKDGQWLLNDEEALQAEKILQGCILEKTKQTQNPNENRWETIRREIQVRGWSEIQKNLSDYLRQYAGVTREKKKLVWINAFHKNTLSIFGKTNEAFGLSLPRWQREVIYANDGGTYFFNAFVDLKVGSCESLQFNGGA